MYGKINDEPMNICVQLIPYVDPAPPEPELELEPEPESDPEGEIEQEMYAHVQSLSHSSSYMT